MLGGVATWDTQLEMLIAVPCGCHFREQVWPCSCGASSCLSGIFDEHESYCGGSDTVLVQTCLGAGWTGSAGDKYVLFKCDSHCGEVRRGGAVLKVESLMMPVHRLSTLTSHAGCFPELTSALHLSLPQALPAGQARVQTTGVLHLYTEDDDSVL